MRDEWESAAYRLLALWGASGLASAVIYIAGGR